MEQLFILTAFGKDRPGIVADVSQVIYEAGCNLEDSTMMRLADEFALILLLSGQDEGLEARLSNECRRLEIEKGLSAFLRPVTPSTEAVSAVAATHRTLRVEGIDQAGIVYKVSRFLAANKINITHLDSRRTFSPESGTAFYKVKIEVDIPDQVPMETVRKGFARLEEELNVDITL
jgi:glycine cleavage system transcriptional repressor